MNGWDLAYLCAAPVFLGAAGYKRWRHGKYRRSLPGMFGANIPKVPLPSHSERVWMHSVSVGETVASAAVFRVLRERHPEWEFLVTTTTETGQDQARRLMAQAQYHDFAPIDFSWKVRRFLQAYQPSLYLFFETEIWPNILTESGRANFPIFLVNGKLSERSTARYVKLRRIFAGPLGRVKAFLMQTEADAERLRRIVGSSASIHVTGNVKFDNLPKPLTAEERSSWRSRWGIGEDQFLLLAGSTHEPEEKILLETFRELQRNFSTLRLAIAPRHPERFDAVARLIASEGMAASRTSQGTATGNGSPVILLDEMGVLGRAFGAADLALMGGSWKPVGGHNLLEPAVHGIPVIHGPHIHEQKEIMRIVKSHRATCPARESELISKLEKLIADESVRRELGKRGQKAAAANAGAATRSVDIIEQYLDQPV